jgi:hypothetical protein
VRSQQISTMDQTINSQCSGIYKKQGCQIFLVT